MIPAKIEIPESEIHQILSNSRRRMVLRCLSESGGVISLKELSTRIAEAESGESPPPSNVRKAVYVALHQTHLPKLDDKGLIEYDRTTNQVELLGAGRDVHLFLESIAKNGATRGVLYRNVSIVALVVIIAALAEVPVISLIGPIVWATLFLGLFVLSVVYGFWKHRQFAVQRLLRLPHRIRHRL